MSKRMAGIVLALGALGVGRAGAANNPAVTVAIDAAADRHAINPMIYGVSFGTPADLKALNAPLNRQGGNTMTSFGRALLLSALYLVVIGGITAVTFVRRDVTA